MSRIKIKMDTDKKTIGVDIQCAPVDLTRVGRLIIADEVLEKSDGLFFVVMSQIAVVRCDHLYGKRAFEYYAYSPHFRPVEPGSIPPAYQVVFHSFEGKVDSFEFVEITPDDLSGVRL